MTHLASGTRSNHRQLDWNSTGQTNPTLGREGGFSRSRLSPRYGAHSLKMIGLRCHTCACACAAGQHGMSGVAACSTSVCQPRQHVEHLQRQKVDGWKNGITRRLLAARRAMQPRGKGEACMRPESRMQQASGRVTLQWKVQGGGSSYAQNVQVSYRSGSTRGQHPA